MKIVILGSGTSHGVPVLGCHCAVCRSKSPKDKRMRSSVLVEGDGGETAVIDTGPEFRLQALRAGICKLDAVFLTHAHADHLHGLDDVRPLSHEKPLPVYASIPAVEELRERFAYVFKATQKGGGKPNIIPVAGSEPVRIGGLRFIPIPVKHGALDVFGWRIEESGRTAIYLTDTSAIPESSLPLIQAGTLQAGSAASPQVFIIGALRERPHETHFNFEQALTAALASGAGQIYLTHLCHDFNHKQIDEYCQNFKRERKIKGVSIHPAWDGLEIGIPHPVL